MRHAEGGAGCQKPGRDNAGRCDPSCVANGGACFGWPLEPKFPGVCVCPATRTGLNCEEAKLNPWWELNSNGRPPKGYGGPLVPKMTQVKAEFAKWVKQYGVHCDDDDPNARANSCGECRECGGECVRKPSAKTGGECIHRYEAPLPGPPERRGRGAHVVGGRAHLRGGPRGGRANGRGKMLQSRGAAKGKGGGAPFGKSGGAPWKPPSPKKVDHLRSKQEGKQSAAALRQHAAATAHVADARGNLPLHRMLSEMRPEPAVLATLDGYADAARVAGAFRRRPLHAACDFGASPAVVQAILDADKGAAAARDAFDDLPLHVALRRRPHRAVVDALLAAAPAAAAARDGDDAWPLQLAAEHPPRADVVEALLAVSASARQAATPGHDDALPLHIAARERMGGRAIDALVKAHPPACAARMANGVTPLHAPPPPARALPSCAN